MDESAPLARHVFGRRHADALLEGFLAYCEEKRLELYPAQEEAILELFAGKHVILATPTGSGKSLVASALHAKSIAEGARSFYTAPIKALVSEKFFALCRELGAANVGLMTGDATVNRDAPVICCTAEILANLALRRGDATGIASVVIDEFHYYADRDRGVAWQIPLLLMRNAQLLLMSGTLGDVRFFEEDLRTRTGREVATVRTMDRPVPLEYAYSEKPLHDALAELIEKDRAPVYVVHFTQRGAAEHAQDLMSVELVDRARKQAIREAIAGVRWGSPYGKELQRFVKHGVGLHHAGLLPKYRLVIEKLAQQGLLAVICGTDTLGVGVNVPIRTVLFTQLCKFDGHKTAILSVRDFHQIAGRAGRKGFDERGWVVVQAPEHVIENKVAREKAEGDPKKQKKLVAKKPPEKGYVHFDQQTFEKLVHGEPERLESRFRVSHAMILQLLEGADERGEDGCRAIRSLVAGSHESRARKFHHGRHAIALFRSLRDAGVIEIAKGVLAPADVETSAPGAETEGGAPTEARRVRVHADLQLDFSLNQALSLFVVDLVPALDREEPFYALDVLSVVEATLEDPEIVLRKQLDAIKGTAVAEMKAEGIEYDERMAKLETLDVPRPLADRLETALAEFATRHPWVPKDGLRPKSIARDMWERGAGFADYVKELGLQRSEGVLLRYLSDAYKALVQSVPETAKTDELHELAEWLRAIVRQTDSSLLDEWESLRDPEVAAKRAVETERPLASADLTTDPKAFTVLVRNAIWGLVRALARREFDRAAALVVAAPGDPAWTADRIADLLVAFEVEHGAIRTDPAARSPAHVRIDRGADRWDIEQTLLDAEGPSGFVLEARIDLPRAREEGAPVIELVGIARA